MAVDTTIVTKIYTEAGGDNIVIQDGGGLKPEPNGTAGTSLALTVGALKLRKAVLTFTDLSVTMTDATTAGCHGSHKIFTWPTGKGVFLYGARMTLTTLAGSGGIADGAALVGSLGVTAVGTDNATLTSTEADVIASTAGTLSSGAGTLSGVGCTAHKLLGSPVSVPDIYLNLAVPDADSSASDTITLNGTVELSWIEI